MKVHVRLFALARQRAGRSEVVVELPEPATVADLKKSLTEAIPELAPLASSLMIAVDSEYAGDDQVVAPGSDVAVIPPVSGGSPTHRNVRPVR